MAMTGEPFCKSAYESFYLMLRNASLFSVFTGVGGIFFTFGRLFIAGISALIGYLFVSKVAYYATSIYSPIAVTCVREEVKSTQNIFL